MSDQKNEKEPHAMEVLASALEIMAEQGAMKPFGVGPAGSVTAFKFGQYAPEFSRRINGGEQHVFSFKNGYGASVVRHRYSYGGSEGLWELAVLTFKGRTGSDYEPGSKYELDYSTPITSDVLARLDEDEVADALKKIEAL